MVRQGDPGKLVVDQALDIGPVALRRLFADWPHHTDPDAQELRNPHLEQPVPEQTRASATPSAVMILVTETDQPQVVLTKRQQGIRFPGHFCFPGGRTETGESSRSAALRECEEEIGVAPEAIELLGTFGHYYTQAGYRIDPFVGILPENYDYNPDPGEVASIHHVSLAAMLNPNTYRLNAFNRERAYFAFEQGDVRVGGPTVSVMIGLLEWLASLH